MTSLPKHAAHDTGEDLEHLVNATRQRLRFSWAIAGIALWEVISIGCLLLMVIIDLLAPLPVWMRVLFFVLFWTLLIGSFIVAVLWPMWHPPSHWAVAMRIEKTVSQMHNRLVSILDLRKREDTRSLAGQPFFVRLLNQTRQRLKNFSIDRVVSSIKIRNALAVAVGMLLLLAGSMLLFGQAVPTAAQRILLPIADIPPARWTRFEPPQPLVVLQGEPLTITAKLQRGSLAELTLRLRQDGGRWHSYPMVRVSPTEFTFEIDRVDVSQDYQFVGGSTWTKAQRITAVVRPIVTDVAMTLQLPAYTGITELQPVPPDAQQVSALAGSMLNVSVAVEGDVVAGRVVLYDKTATRLDEVVESERVWVDDSFPSDTKPIGRVNWINSVVSSGSHSFRSARSGQATGFRTRLEPFIVEPDELITFYAYRPKRPAVNASSTVSFLIDEQWQKLIIATEESIEKIKAEDENQFVPLQKTPPVETWTRITVTPEQLMRTKPDGPITINGLSIQSKGPMLFDRFGATRQETQSSFITELEETGSLPMSLDEATERWVGRVPVDREVHLRFEFTNQLGHANRPTQPLRIVPIEDQPPSIVLERPDKDLTLPQIEPVTLAARVFDDYGVASIQLEVGKDPELLSPAGTLTDFDQPTTVYLMQTAMNPATHGLKPDQPIYIRLRVVDRKALSSVSEVVRISLTSTDDQTPTARDQQIAALNAAVESMGELLDAPADMLDVVGELLEEITEATDNTVAELLEMVNEQNGQMTAEQLQELINEQVAQLSDEQQAQLFEAEQALVDQQAQLAEAAESLAEAMTIEQSMDNPTPFAEHAIAQAQEVVSELQDEQPANATADQTLTAEELQGMSQMQEQQLQVAQLQEQVEQIQQAQEQWMQDPQAAQEQMQQASAAMQAQQAAEQMEELAQTLSDQQQQMQQLSQEQQQLQEQTNQADTGSELAQASDQQEQFDPGAIEALNDAEELLNAAQPPQAAAAQQEQSAMPEAWSPPEAGEQTPQSEDYWQQPVDSEQQQAAAEQAQSQEQGQTESSQQAQSEQTQPTGEMTPQQMLQEHQEQMQEALTETSESLGEQAEAAQALAEQLQALAEQIAGEPGEPSEPGEQGEPSSESQQQAMQQLAAMMQSSAMQQAQAMAQAAQQQQQESQSESSESQGEPGGLPTDSGYDPDTVLRDLPADQRMKLYRLPPSVRQPLLEGMRQRGPEGYQALIDAYYRQLTQEQP